MVVVNTHLYATHVASDGAVLPEHDVVVFDEAHEVEEVMTDGLGIEITAGRFRRPGPSGTRRLLGADDAGSPTAWPRWPTASGSALRRGAAGACSPPAQADRTRHRSPRRAPTTSSGACSSSARAASRP